jgi:hypothetical protein
MGKRRYRDIEIRGTVYPTVQDVADALGVTPRAVTMAIRKGTTDRIGTGAVGSEPMPVRIRGRVYPDAGAAAKALGVTRGRIHQAINRGHEDRVGLPPSHNGARAKPVRVGGLDFPSMAAASRALGFRSEYLSRVMTRGSKRGRERILAAAMAYAAKNPGQDGPARAAPACAVKGEAAR